MKFDRYHLSTNEGSNCKDNPPPPPPPRTLLITMNNNKTDFSLLQRHAPFRHSYAFYTASFSTSVIMAIASPVSGVGNALVLVAIWRNAILRTPSYILIAGLAFTDLCTGLITEPFYVALSLIFLANPKFVIVHNRPMTYRVIGAISSFSAKYFYQVSLLMVTLMSVERWLHMSRRSVMTGRRACFAVALLFLIAIPLVLFGFELVSGLVYYATSISLLLVCITVTSFTYFKIFRIIRRHQQQIHATSLSQDFAQPAINFDKYKKSIVSILYILFIFYLGYLPLTISFVLLLVLRHEFSVLLITVSTMLVFLSSALNPLLYLGRMKDIRDEVKRLVKRIFHKDN